jgi:5'-nucleotidase
MPSSPRRTLLSLTALTGTVAVVAATLAAQTSVAAPGGEAGGSALKAGTSAAATYADLTAPSEPRRGKRDYTRLDLLALNDFHGNLEAPTGSSGTINATPAGGAAYLATLLKQERRTSRANGAVPLTVAAGDLIGASPLLSAAFHDEPSITALNQMGLDVASVGNHEFDEGVGELLRMQRGGCLPDGPEGANGANSCPADQEFQGADFKYLGANVRWKPGTGHKKPTPFKPYKILRVGQEKVGFIGMTLEGTPEIVAQAGIADVTFQDEVETANALVPVLRKKGVKSIIVLLHEGVTPGDPTAYNGCTKVTGPALSIAQSLSPKIDAVVSGHTHQPYNCVVKDPKGQPRLLTSASSFGRMITKLHFLIDPRTHDIVRPAAYAENIINANGEGQRQQPAIVKLIDTFKTLVAPIANAVVGRLGGGATSVSRGNDADGSKDSPLGNLIADAQKADPTLVSSGRRPVIAFMNPGGIRADLAATATGDVTYGSAFTVQPFNNFMVSMDLTGAQVKAILNEGFNGTNEGPATGGANKVLQVSGISFTWDASEAGVVGGTAVVPSSVMVDADGDPATPMVPIQDGTTYRVAANQFLSDGGDGFATFRAGTNKLVGGLDIDALRVYLQANNPYTVTPTDRITVQE